ncbi:MAG: hypothetical protein KDD47_16335 [Acidobacteria bacterium]|nr:hypothetical protein [Acidobacteriota bacterium]
MKRGTYVGWLALVLGVLALPAVAGTFQQIGLEGLVDTSSAAIEGEVLAVDSFWDEEGRIILTEATVHVRDKVFGDTAEVVKVRTFGGTVDGYTIDAPGFPTFAAGERLFLFVSPFKAEGDTLRVTGYQQGQFRIGTGAGKVEVAESALDGDALLLDLGNEVDLLPRSLPLSELKGLVKTQASLKASGTESK